MTGSPEIFFPRISGSDMFWSSNAWLPISSLRLTVSRFWLGSSMPITLRPGMVATRADSADMLRAMSSASWMTRLALIPLAGSSSYMVTTGPGRTSTMSPRTWKSSSTLSSRRALRSRPARSILPLGFSGGLASSSMRRQLVIVAEREARLAGQRARLALASARPWRRQRSAGPGRPRQPPGATAAERRCLPLRRPAPRGCGGAVAPGWCRGAAYPPPIASPPAECRARTSRRRIRSMSGSPSAPAATALRSTDCRPAAPRQSTP